MADQEQSKSGGDDANKKATEASSSIDVKPQDDKAAEKSVEQILRNLGLQTMVPGGVSTHKYSNRLNLLMLFRLLAERSKKTWTATSSGKPSPFPTLVNAS